MAETIVIFCAIPGRHRGGLTHPAAAQYPLGALSRKALEEIAADPVLHIARGELVTTANLAALLADSEAAAKAPTKKAERA